MAAAQYPEKAAQQYSFRIRTEAPAKKTVVFDAFHHELVGGPFIRARHGELSFDAEFSYPWSFHVWVTRPYGTPVCLYSDGTDRVAASTDPGLWNEKAQTLTLNCTHRAFVSTPVKPAAVTALDGTHL